MWGLWGLVRLLFYRVVVLLGVDVFLSYLVFAVLFLHLEKARIWREAE